MIKASFVMPVKNGEQFIKKTIDSLASQTEKNIEIVVVNDHSEDRTLEIAHELAKKDSRIVVINQADKSGVGAARNAGTKIAQGEIIFPVDSDDPNFPQRIEVSLNEMTRTDSDIFYGNMERFYADSGKRELRHFQPYDETMYKMINFIGHGASAFKKKVYDKVGPYDEELKVGEDYDFFLSAQESGFKFCCQNIAVAQYTMHAGQATATKDPEAIFKRQTWNKLVRTKHKILEINSNYVRENAEPEVVDFYVNKNYDIWFAPESIPEKQS